jgi:hypothetical protein
VSLSSPTTDQTNYGFGQSSSPGWLRGLEQGDFRAFAPPFAQSFMPTPSSPMFPQSAPSSAPIGQSPFPPSVPIPTTGGLPPSTPVPPMMPSGLPTGTFGGTLPTLPSAVSPQDQALIGAMQGTPAPLPQGGPIPPMMLGSKTAAQAPTSVPSLGGFSGGYS